MDPRRQRTQHRLQNALITLLHAHDFDDIRVIDLVEEAEVALPTFYRNYENKVDLLQKTLHYLGEQISEDHENMNLLLNNLLESEQITPTLPIIRFIDDNFMFFQRLLKTSHNMVVFQTILDVASKQIRKDTPEWQPHEVDLIAGSVVGCIYQWVLSERKYSADEIAYMVHWTTVSGVLALRGKLNETNIASMVDSE